MDFLVGICFTMILVLGAFWVSYFSCLLLYIFVIFDGFLLEIILILDLLV